MGSTLFNIVINFLVAKYQRRLNTNNHGFAYLINFPWQKSRIALNLQPFFELAHLFKPLLRFIKMHFGEIFNICMATMLFWPCHKIH